MGEWQIAQKEEMEIITDLDRTKVLPDFWSGKNKKRWKIGEWQWIKKCSILVNEFCPDVGMNAE